MKHFFKLFLLIFFIGFVAQAQDFITHKVKDNESVKELAKTYGVSITQILNLNPDANKDLKIGSVLIIPNVKTTKETKTVNNIIVADPKVSKATEVKDVAKTSESLNHSIRSGSSEVISSSKTYIVKKSEGKWRIAQNYGITVDQLEKSNPQIIKGLKEGDTLKIPIKTYKVLPSEGFF
jgi:LysM repeat protein